MTTSNDQNERLSRMLETPPPAVRREEDTSVSERVDQARDRAQDVAEQARHRAEQAGHEATERVDSAMTATGERIGDVARTIRERAPDGGQVGEIAENTARALERSSDYLRRSDPQDVRRDLEGVMRDHPIESLAVGLGFGFLIARSMRSRRN